MEKNIIFTGIGCNPLFYWVLLIASIYNTASYFKINGIMCCIVPNKVYLCSIKGENGKKGRMKTVFRKPSHHHLKKPKPGDKV